MIHPLRKSEAWALAGATTLAMSLSYIDRQTLAVLAPTITKALGISDVGYGWLGAAFSFAYLIGGPLAGVWIDRVGARRGLLVALVIWSAVGALQAAAPGLGALVAIRLALGLAESPTFPGGVQIVQRGLAQGDRPRGMSLVFVGMSFGGMLAPPIAVGLGGWLGWRAAFLGTAALTVVWVPLWLAVTSSARVRAVLDDSSNTRARPSFLETAADPAVIRGLVGLIAIVPASAFAMTWEAKFYVRTFALTQKGVASYLVASAFAYDAGAILFGDLAARRERRRGYDRSPPRGLLGCAVLLAATGLAGLVLAPEPHAALVCFIACNAGRGAVVTLHNIDTLARVPSRAVSTASGVIASIQSLGAIVTNPVLGHVVENFGYRPALAVLAAWTVPGTIAWLLMPVRSEAQPVFEGSGVSAP
jgi:ACS family hexuronate transporter-like MFS transporter